MRHKVFVYGSLKKGFLNDGLLQDSEFCGSGETAMNRYTMFSLGLYPAVALGGKDTIKGEVYFVDDWTLTELDLLEGNGTFYNRRPTLVGDEVCWMYVIENDGNSFINDEVVSEGNWTKEHENYIPKFWWKK